MPLEQKKLELEEQKIILDIQKAKYQQEIRQTELAMQVNAPQQHVEQPEPQEHPEREDDTAEIMAETNNLRVKQAELQQQVVLTNAIVDSVNNLTSAVMTPKPIRVIRDENGIIQGAE